MTTAKNGLDRIKAEAHDKWEKLTDEDIDAIKGNVTELSKRLQAHYGLSAADARKQADGFMEAISEAASEAVDEARKVGQDAYRSGRARTRQVYGQAVDVLDDGALRVDRALKENAWATLGGALLLGGLVGFMFGSEGRRPRRR